MLLSSPSPFLHNTFRYKGRIVINQFLLRFDRRFLAKLKLRSREKVDEQQQVSQDLKHSRSFLGFLSRYNRDHPFTPSIHEKGKIKDWLKTRSAFLAKRTTNRTWKRKRNKRPEGPTMKSHFFPLD